MKAADGDPRQATTDRLLLVVAGAGLVVAVAGAVVGIHLANEVRFECGDIERLVQLVCSHTVHPHARAGWLTAVICVFVGLAVAGASLVRRRRMMSGTHPLL